MNKDYYIKNIEKFRESARNHYKNNKEKHSLYQKNRLMEYKKNAFEAMGGVCVRCGFSDYRALQIDHIQGNGQTHRMQMGIRGTTPIYYNLVESSVKNNEGRYQLLCANCNWIKRVENKEQHKQFFTGRKQAVRRGLNGG